MDRAPILEVDVPAGLDATVQMLQSRMTHVEIERDYEPGLPPSTPTEASSIRSGPR
jgi:hypothetical protein